MKKMSKKGIPTEAWHQEQVFNWSYNNEPKYPCLKYMTGSINGVYISKTARRQLVKQGLKKGVPDINLPAKNKFYSGLYIELKNIDGGDGGSPEQHDYLKFLQSQGYFVCFCNGHQAAIEVIEKYLKDGIKRLQYI